MEKLHFLNKINTFLVAVDKSTSYLIYVNENSVIMDKM